MPLRVRSYLLLVFGFYVCGFHLAFITVHMPAYLIDLGFSAYLGALSISIIGFCNIFGAYYAGVASNSFSKRKLLITIYLGRAIAITFFLSLPISTTSVLIFSAVMGFLWLATVPPTSSLVATFFGTRYMSFLYGIVFFSHQVGSFTGVWLGGWLYENFGSYDRVWIAGIVLGLIAAFFIFIFEKIAITINCRYERQPMRKKAVKIDKFRKELLIIKLKFACYFPLISFQQITKNPKICILLMAILMRKLNCQ